MSRSFIAALACIALVSACGRKSPSVQRVGPMDSPAFWVWHRSSPLKPAERNDLKRAGVRTLYWQAEECAWAGSAWRTMRPISKPMKGTADLRIIPVFRIQPDTAFLEDARAPGLFAAHFRNWSGETSDAGEIQLDFDCPDRLLELYAAFLKELGKQLAPTRISITALAAWPRHPAFGKLADSVHSLAPMFYDITPDDPGDVNQSRFRPLADPAVVELIRLWKRCPRPWLAGLPDFERLSVFAADGALVGHLRGWEHDPLFFHPKLAPRPLGEGITAFKVNAPVELADKSFSTDQTLVHRAPEEGFLTTLVAEADTSGATGIIWFALPGPGIQATFSAGHLAELPNKTAVSPTLVILKNGAVVLKNPGPADLPPRACDPAHPDSRGWRLELRSDEPGAFQPASPGAFAASDTPGSAPPEFSDTLILRFSKLPAGQSIVSGPVIGNPHGLRWKLCDVTDESSVISIR